MVKIEPTGRELTGRVEQMFLLDRGKKRSSRFSGLRPEVVTSVVGVRQSVAKATKDSLWVSYEKDLTEALVKAVHGPSRLLGRAVLIHAMNPQSLAALVGCFQGFAFAAADGFLPPDELAEALQGEKTGDLFIGGSVDLANRRLTLWRGTLESLTVPFTAFEKSGDGIEPDFKKFAVTDFGQTVRLGEYEAAGEAILYEFDPEYRRRVARERRLTERTFGGAVRRLRKQRGLRREDFEPEVTAKTIARIEQGKVSQDRIHKRTLETIARKLGVKAEEIETF